MSTRWRMAAGAAALAAALGWAGLAQAQQVSGQAAAVRATVLGVTTSLADSGSVSDPSQPAGTGLSTGSIGGLLSAEALHAAAMGWTDQVASQASLGNLSMSVAGIGITAAFLGSEALAVAGAAGSGVSAIEGLRIGGVAISPTGLPNQQVSVPGLSVILNEQAQTASGIVVNALRVRTLDGLTDIVLASSRAGI
jgi:hypothetical protein